MVRIPTCIAALGVVLALGGVARAGDKEDKVVKHVKAAQEASGNGDHATAIKEYEAGYKLLPNPNLLVAIALEHREAGQSEKARDTLRRFLKDAPADHKRRAEVSALLAKFEAEGAAGADPAPAAAAEPATDFTPEAIPLQLEDVEKPAEQRERERREKAAAARRAPDASLGLPTLEQTSPEKEPIETPFYKTWWFWTLTGVIVGGTVAVGLTLSQPTANPIRSCGRQFIGCYGDGR